MKNLCTQSLAWLLLVSLLLESCHNLIDKETPIPQDSCQGDNLVPPLSLSSTNQEEEAVNKLASNSQASNLLALQAHESKEEPGPGVATILARHGEIFSTFPKEIWQHILSYVPAEHIGKIRQANRTFYRLTTGYDQPGVVGVDNKPTYNIKVDSWVINRKINFKYEERFQSLTPSTVPSLLFYQFLTKAKYLPQSFWPYLVDTHIKEMDFQYGGMGWKRVAELAKYLQGANARVVGLMSNQPGASGAQSLAKEFARPQVHTLNLASNYIGRMAGSLAEALSHTQIRRLYLGSNNLFDSGAQSLAKELSKTQIHTLDLSSNDIGDSGVQSLVMELPKTQIHTLDLGVNQIGASGAQTLAKELSKTQIHTLDLGVNQIGASGARSLAAELSKTQIHTLDLKNNNIGDSGVQLLAAELSKTQIHTLSLRGNSIGASGARSLANALPNTQIHTLNLSYNQIGDSGVQALVKVLSKTQIHTLDLAGNQIGELGVRALAANLSKTQIHTLDLAGKQISSPSQRLLRKQYPKIKWYF